MVKKAVKIRTPANGKKEKVVSRVRWSPEEQAVLVETAAAAMKNKEVFSMRDAQECRRCRGNGGVSVPFSRRNPEVLQDPLSPCEWRDLSGEENPGGTYISGGLRPSQTGWAFFRHQLVNIQCVNRKKVC